MEKKLKVGISPILLIMWVVIVATVVGFCATTYLGLVDLRTEEQILEEYRENLIGHDLFDDAKTFGRDILLKNRVENVIRISCLKINASGNIKKLVLIEYNDDTRCYATTIGDNYAQVASDIYSDLRRRENVVSELILEGSDLNILFEEVNK